MRVKNLVTRGQQRKDDSTYRLREDGLVFVDLLLQSFHVLGGLVAGGLLARRCGGGGRAVTTLLHLRLDLFGEVLHPRGVVLAGGAYHLHLREAALEQGLLSVLGITLGLGNGTRQILE